MSLCRMRTAKKGSFPARGFELRDALCNSEKPELERQKDKRRESAKFCIVALSPCVTASNHNQLIPVGRWCGQKTRCETLRESQRQPKGSLGSFRFLYLNLPEKNKHAPAPRLQGLSLWSSEEFLGINIQFKIFLILIFLLSSYILFICSEKLSILKLFGMNFVSMCMHVTSTPFE